MEKEPKGIDAPDFALPRNAFQKLDPYSLHYLSAHLHEAAMSNPLYRLVTKPAWFIRSSMEDASGLYYRRDIDRACQATESWIDAEIGKPSLSDTAEKLVRPAALAWLSAGRGRVAGTASLRTLEAMAMTGEVEQALRRAEIIPDPIRAIRALARVGDAASGLGRSTEAHKAWTRARERLRRVSPDFFNDNLSAAALLARSLSAGGRTEDALETAGMIETEVRRETKLAGGVNSVAQIARAAAWGAVGNKKGVLNAVATLDDDGFRIGALTEAARNALSCHGELAHDLLNRALSLMDAANPLRADFELALLLAETGRKRDAERAAGEKIFGAKHARLLAALAKGAIVKGRTDTGRNLLKEAFKTAHGLLPDKSSLQVVEEIVGCGFPRIASGGVPGLFVLIDIIRAECKTALTASDWGILALGLAASGNDRQAKTAIEASFDWKPPLDDWQEMAALCLLAELLGRRCDIPGLEWILARAKSCINAWQQAELAYGLARAFRTAGDGERAVETEEILKAAAMGKNSTHWRPNARGVMVLWHHTSGKPGSKKMAREMVTALMNDMAKGDAPPDDLAELALTLARGDAMDLAGAAQARAMDAIRGEPDPNTVARTIGTAAEAAMIAKIPEALHPLVQTALTIEDDWLGAEALFWVSGWKAYGKDWEGARKLFYNGASKGLETPFLAEKTRRIPGSGWLNDVERIARDIGWPSTQAAVIFSGLMISLENPDAERIQRGLLVLNQMTEGYDHIRFVCHRRLMATLDELQDRKTDLIRYWIRALEHNRKRDAGEVWAVIGAGLPLLTHRFGSAFPVHLRRELARLGKMGSGMGSHNVKK